MALATTDDLEQRLGRDLTDSELIRATALLDDVSASVCGYTGQSFAAATTTARFKIRNGIVRLSQRPVLAVTAVKDTNGNDAAYEWDTFDRLDVRTQVFDSWSMEPYRTALRYVDVTYEHGYGDVPPDILGLVCSITLRALGQDPTEGGVVSEQIDGYSYRLGSASGAGAYGLLPDERECLDRYKRLGGTVVLAQ